MWIRMGVFGRFECYLDGGVEFFVLSRLLLGSAVCNEGNHQRLQLLDSGAKLKSLTVAKLNVTPAGDEMVAFRVTITAGKSGLTVDLYADIIVIRSGRIIASPTFQAQFSPFDIDETERLVALAADRLPNS